MNDGELYFFLGCNNKNASHAPIVKIPVPDAINPQNLLGDVILSNASDTFC